MANRELVVNLRVEEWHEVDKEKVDRFQALLNDLSACCDAETSACKEHWSPDDPAHGQCVVFALIFQDYFGGELLRASLISLPRYAHMRSHYWNRLPDGMQVDLTGDQFNDGEDRKLVPLGELKTREYLLSDPNTARRYQMLKEKLLQTSDTWRE